MPKLDKKLQKYLLVCLYIFCVSVLQHIVERSGQWKSEVGRRWESDSRLLCDDVCVCVWVEGERWLREDERESSPACLWQSEKNTKRSRGCILLSLRFKLAFTVWRNDGPNPSGIVGEGNERADTSLHVSVTSSWTKRRTKEKENVQVTQVWVTWRDDERVAAGDREPASTRSSCSAELLCEVS